MKIISIKLIAVGTLLSNSVFAQNVSNDHSSHIIEKNTISNFIDSNKQNEIADNKMFVCPMHPEIMQEEFGNCPICGMDLVEKNLSNNSKINEVVISKGMQQNLNIKTKKASFKRVTPIIKNYGKITYNEDTIIHQHLRVDGWIESSNILKEGQYVKKDEKLFEVYSEDLIVAQQDFILTLKSKNKNLIERSKRRLKLLGLNNKLINEISKTKKVLYTVPFYAETSGYIKDFEIRKGMFVSKNNTLFSIVNQDTYWVTGYAFESDKKNIIEGSSIKITVNGNEFYDAKVDYIYPELDNETLSLKYRATINNEKESLNLKPNTIVNMELMSTKKIMGLFVPLESLIQTENKNRVVVKTKTGFVVKEVLVGFKNDKIAQILKGLELKDEIVISGQFLIDSEASLIGATLRTGGSDE